MYQSFLIFALITDIEFRCQECLLCPTFIMSHILSYIVEFLLFMHLLQMLKRKRYFIDGMIVRVVMLTKEGVEVGGGVDGEQFPGLD